MSKLFSPLKIRGVEFKNRLGVSPMCLYFAEDGFFNEKHFVHLGSMAAGGSALVIIEATAVEPEGRTSPGDAGLWKDEQIDFLKKIVSFIKGYNCVPGIQLAHAGRKASAARPWHGDCHLKSEEGGWNTKAPSPIPFDEKRLWKQPHELQIQEIQEIQEKFVSAAKRAITAGIEVIEIHGAHGYLIDEFYSPLANKRTDQYGGSFENRIRFLSEITEKVRKAIPETVPLFVRLSTVDWHKDGWTIEDSVKLAKILKSNGVDLIDASSGGNYNHQPGDIPSCPGYQVPFAEKIRKEAEIPTAAVGLIKDAILAESIMEEGKADIVLIGRESLKNPHFPYFAAVQLGVEKQFSTVPLQYAFGIKSHY